MSRPILKRALVVVLAIFLFAAGILPAIIVASNQRSFATVLWALLALTLMLLSFDLLHVALGLNGDGARLFKRGARGMVLDLGHVVLAASLTLATFGIQHASDPICGGGLGAGFPASFICDASGSSPISDWGKMSWTDIPNPIGAPIDILFYAALIWGVVHFATKGINQIPTRRLRRNG
jgi:hypothetical protein